MAVKAGAVYVDFGIKTDTFQKGMQNASKGLNKFSSDAGRVNKQLSTSFAKMGSIAKTALGGLVGGIVAGGVLGVASQLKDVANSIARIGEEAKRAGVSAKAFQEWKFVAEQNRIGIDQMTDGLKELNLRADEFIQTGKGSAAEAFMRLGYGAEELEKKLKDPSALLLEIIDRLGKFDKAAQIRISDELFGGSAGERFVELVDQGEAGIRRTIDRGHDLGIVLDDEVIKRAAEIDRRFNEISNTVGMRLKSAIVSAADSLAEFIDGFREFENQNTRTLDNKIIDLGRKRLGIENEILRLQDEQRNNHSATAMAEGKVLEATLSAKRSELAAISKTEAELLAIINNRTTAMARTGDRTWTPPKPPPGGFGSGGGGRDKAAAAAEREAEAVRRLIAELEHELQLVGATDLQRETANALRRAGAAATADQQAQIVALVSALYAEEEALRKASDAAAELQEIGRDVLGGMVADLREGKSAADILANALDRVADKLLNMALDGLFSGGSGFLGALFKADGGIIKAATGGKIRGPGGPKADRIPAMLSNGEFVVNAKATKQWGALLAAINSGMKPNLEAMAKAFNVEIPKFSTGGIAWSPGGECGPERIFKGFSQ